MIYRKYIVLAFVAALFLPLLSAKTVKTPNEIVDISNIHFIELESGEELEFNTEDYLPQDFNPYQGKPSISTFNFIEDDQV
ncbi:MAG: hypothetical protein KJN65_02695, partial [Croceitalea sp.]|nr:hypothetical protein [Croceitalea sp.]